MNAQVKEWCRQECIRQHATTERDFLGMEYAWGYAKYISELIGPLNVGDIQRMAEYIDSAANPGGGFRTGPAVFMGGGSAAPAHHISDWLNTILSRIDDFSPEEFYRELMYIHPFRDGNGRVGALVYNILNGTIDNPVDPPEYK